VRREVLLLRFRAAHSGQGFERNEHNRKRLCCVQQGRGAGGCPCSHYHPDLSTPPRRSNGAW
jgi:hypothetical protein